MHEGDVLTSKGGTRKKDCYRFPTPSVILERFTTLSGSGLQRWRVLKAQIRRSCVEEKLIREEYLNTSVRHSTCDKWSRLCKIFIWHSLYNFQCRGIEM